MDVRINVIIPNNLYKRSQQLVQNGYFSNFSELIRHGLRREIKDYEGEESLLLNDERKLLLLLKKADKEGELLDEKEMRKHGLKI